VKPKGAFLNIITPGGSIANAGLLSGDVITSVDGKPVSSAATLEQAIAKHRAGDKVKLDAMHLGKPGHFTLTLVATSSAPATPATTPITANPIATKHVVEKPTAGHPAPATMAQAQTAHAAAPSANVRWTRWADPAENAFSLEVPAGWRVSGGTQRKSAIEIPMGVVATSPDSAITIIYSDPGIPIFSVPSRMTAFGGLRLGMPYDLGQGVHTIIMPYMDGRTFAAEWGKRRVSTLCASTRLMASRGRPDSSHAIDAAYAQGGLRVSVNAGEASFACNLAGKEAGGYAFAATELVQSPMGAIWDVKYNIACIAPASHAAEAYAILAHMAASFAIDRAWMARERELGAQFDRIVAETNAAVSQRIIDNGRAAEQISDMIIKGGQARSEETFNANEKYDAFAVRGTSDYVTESGRVYPSVDNSHAHVYVNNTTGAVMPTDSENSPGYGWTEAKQVPPGQ